MVIMVVGCVEQPCCMLERIGFSCKVVALGRGGVSLTHLPFSPIIGAACLDSATVVITEENAAELP